MTLSEALRVTPGQLAALVGGGGKTTAMFRLAEELTQAGGKVITTTTTRIFAAQTRLAPIHVQSIADLDEAVKRHAHILLTGEVEIAQGKAFGLTPEAVDGLRTRFPGRSILVEADGSRMRPFKAPAAHEPVIPRSADLVVPVVGIDALGAPLTAEFVHRPERVAAIFPGERVTVEMIAAVLRHPAGGRKNAPPGARVMALINKVDDANAAAAEQLAGMLVAPGGLDGVVTAALGRTPADGQAQVLSVRYAAN